VKFTFEIVLISSLYLE